MKNVLFVLTAGLFVSAYGMSIPVTSREELREWQEEHWESGPRATALDALSSIAARVGDDIYPYVGRLAELSLGVWASLTSGDELHAELPGIIREFTRKLDNPRELAVFLHELDAKFAGLVSRNREEITRRLNPGPKRSPVGALGRTPDPAAAAPASVMLPAAAPASTVPFVAPIRLTVVNGRTVPGHDVALARFDLPYAPTNPSTAVGTVEKLGRLPYGIEVGKAIKISGPAGKSYVLLYNKAGEGLVVRFFDYTSAEAGTEA